MTVPGSSMREDIRTCEYSSISYVRGKKVFITVFVTLVILNLEIYCEK